MRTLDFDQFWPFDPEPVGDTAIPPPIPHVEAESSLQPVAPLATSHVTSATAKYRRHARTFLRSFDAVAAAWVTLGFITGMMAWHAIGFWGFVSETVLAHNDSGASSIWVAPTKLQHKAASPITTRQGPCVALIIDRASGATTTAPCPNTSESLRDAGVQRMLARTP